jgi:hypothetical protein
LLTKRANLLTAYGRRSPNPDKRIGSVGLEDREKNSGHLLQPQLFFADRSVARVLQQR